MQTYPSGPVQYNPVYHDPNAYTQPYQAPDYPEFQDAPAAYEEPYEGPQGEPQYESEAEPYRGAFEPLVPPTGDDPYGPTRSDLPLGTEQGDSEPWQGAGEPDAGTAIFPISQDETLRRDDETR